jgi:hypothetical protein
MNDFVYGMIVGMGLMSWFTALWVYFLMKTVLGRNLIEKFKR